MIMYLQKTGFIEVIAGCMFSGKTEELIRRVRRAQIAKQNLLVIKPSIDTRYDENDVVSHSKSYFKAQALQKIEEIYSLDIEKFDVIAIDEAQFFGEKIVDVCNDIANKGKRVIVAGLDLDYMGRPFGAMPQLMAIAEYVTKTQAICTVCGNPASHSQRITKSKELVLLGSDSQYEPRCRLHFNKEEGV